MPDLETPMGDPAWGRFMAAALKASEVFARRGRFGDQMEEAFRI